MPSSTSKPPCFSDRDWKVYSLDLPDDRKGLRYNVCSECTPDFQNISLRQGKCNNPNAFKVRQLHFI